MKRILLALLILPIGMFAQINADVSFGNTIPNAQVEQGQLKTESPTNFTFGLNYLPKKIGFSLQGSFHQFLTNQNYLDRLKELNPTISFTKENWTNNFMFVGPLTQLGDQRVNFEFFPKIGLGYIKSPDREVSYSSNNIDYLLYKDNASTANLNGIKPYWGFDTKLNVGISKHTTFQIFSGWTTNTFFSDGYSIQYRDLSEYNGEQLIDDLSESEVKEKEFKANSLFTVGIGIKFIPFFPEKEDKDKSEDMLPPVPSYPKDKDTLSREEARELTLEWQKETPGVKEAKYEFYLYQMKENEPNELIHQTKLDPTLNYALPEDVKLIPGKRYEWRVRAVDHPDLEPCRSNCRSIKYEFEVAPIVIPQYYHLFAEKKGNHVPVSEKLRFILEDKVLSGSVNLVITDEKGETVFEVNNVTKENESMGHAGKNRYEIDLQPMKEGQQYTLKISSARRSYYLRFLNTAKHEERE